ncbi:phage transcriptional activator, RinA family [Pilibacter termitis]|uniref:Phage transcriptional activator, RinA family n=2 Tax=Pilibacter termitis TaxID=263852 RepID=A0A1T4PE44_9ENTE|nr:phage transcriptional activator, RinA family [Pilibacter termitis]
MKQYILERKEELRAKKHIEDENFWIKGSNKNNFEAENYIIKLEQDKRLAKLEKQYIAVRNCLERADDDTKALIQEFYLQEHSAWSFHAFAEKMCLNKNQATSKVNKFIDELEYELIR